MTKGFLQRIAAVAGTAMLVMASAAPAKAITILDPAYDAQRVIPGFNYQALAFAGDDLWAANGNSLCKFANAANLPIGGTFAPSSGQCGISNVSMNSLAYDGNGNLYGFNGGIFKIDMATLQATFMPNSNLGGTHGFAIDPRDGAIFQASILTGKIFRYDLATQTNSVFFDAGAAGLGGIHRMTILPDGTIVAGGYTAGKLLIVSGYSASTPTGNLIAAKPLLQLSPTGITYAGGDIYIGLTGGRVSRVDLNAPFYTETTIVSDAGGYIEDAAISPNGHIWYSTLFGGSQGTFRLTLADGSGIEPPPAPPPPSAPAPGALLLLGPGLAALALTRRARR